MQLAALVGISPTIAAIRSEIEKIADADASVLITGPSGSGKDVVARLLHQKSRRAARPFVALNCAAVPADLLESEMFGHELGAFTGAVKARAGRFEAAHGGTLFLDEVGDMPAAMQAKLLRTLETRVIERVGGMLPIGVDVRVVAATSVDLTAAIAAGRFRADLLYRLDVIHIAMPPLNERPEDVPCLVQHFLSAAARPARFTPAALEALAGLPWPGNVRELKNFVERACIHHGDETIGREALAQLLRGATSPPQPKAAPRPNEIAPPPGVKTPDHGTASLLGPDGVDLKQLLTDLEQAYIREALALSGGTIARCARLLGLQRTTLIEKMRRMQIAVAE
ncbi:sigma-54 dependent transcriptional regulator [Sandarakinorhabdus sp. AAP62]|uniref:sigma-54 interaction domain-containing protein n=1 Tax=Sandarakinorhabdus sp. AAP62 TaxID=1248916 RepID=UPI0003015561|nr:sigma-54 dependent transcriptional regulator [Sandarakinorhabdus sp. AAP62]